MSGRRKFLPPTWCKVRMLRRFPPNPKLGKVQRKDISHLNADCLASVPLVIVSHLDLFGVILIWMKIIIMISNDADNYDFDDDQR